MMDNNDSNSSDVLTSFMNKQVDKSSSRRNKNNKVSRINKTKQALEKARMKEEEEESNKIREVKKDSRFKASRYNQAEMRKRGAKEFMVMIPFIALGILFLFMLVFKGGPMLKDLISSFFKSAIGG
ncbi:hypothetical protein ACFL0U_01495 [Pseudomonadota bacterium]